VEVVDLDGPGNLVGLVEEFLVGWELNGGDAGRERGRWSNGNHGLVRNSSLEGCWMTTV